MSGVATAIVGGAVIGGYMTSQATKSAAQTQADAAARAQGQLLATGSAASDLYNPYTTKGITALNKMAEDPYFTHQFNNQDLNANLAPNYAWGLDVGQKTNLMGSNATGGAVSGNAQAALNQFSQNYAQNAYQNAFANYQGQRQNIYGNLGAIANYGLTGTQGQANAMLGTGTNIANIGIGAGNAAAASQISQGNILGGIANTAGNMAGYYAMNNTNQPTGGGTAGNLQSLNWQSPEIAPASSGGGFGLNPA